jgi:hypothetical protein
MIITFFFDCYSATVATVVLNASSLNIICQTNIQKRHITRFSVSVFQFVFPPIIACNKKVKIQLYIYI